MNDVFSNNRLMVGNRVFELRTSQGLSQRKLATMVCADHAYICKLEAGSVNPTLDMLTRLSIGLGVKIVHFLDEASEIDYAFITDIDCVEEAP